MPIAKDLALHRASPRLIALTPLLALAFCASLIKPVRAQMMPLPLYVVSDTGIPTLVASTDPSYSTLINQPFLTNPGGDPVYTDSESTVYTDVDTPASVTDQTYTTTIDATLGGASIFDMTFNAAYTDSAVQAAVAKADARLAADGAAFGSPTLASSQASATTSTRTVVTGQDTVPTQTDQFTHLVGAYPGGTILTAQGLIIGPTGGFMSGVNLLIQPGQTDVNADVESQFNVYRTVTTTTTDTLTQTYDIVGTPNATGPAVPEASPVALLALGLLPLLGLRWRNPT